MRYLRFIPLLLILLDACVDPLQLKLSSSGSRMVVDGMITNEQGPYQVKLFYSSNLENSANLPTPVTAASVSIVSSLNETELLTEISPGVYESSAAGIHGQVGVSYYLKIITKSREYQSKPQTLVAAGTIDDILFEFSPEGVTDQFGFETEASFKIYINSHGEEESSNLYRWRWTGVYKVKTFPELYTTGNVNDANPVRPRPWPCSGYKYEQGILFKTSECECCICWAYDFSSSPLVSDPRFIQNNEFNKIDMGSIGISPMMFYERYHLEVEQLSVSEQIHNFWKLVEAQQKALGSLFQPNAVKVRGNIECISNPNEEVLGIFSVSAVTRKAIFIERENVPYTLAGIDTIKYDCRTYFKNSTTEKPLFW